MDIRGWILLLISEFLQRKQSSSFCVQTLGYYCSIDVKKCQNSILFLILMFSLSQTSWCMWACLNWVDSGYEPLDDHHDHQQPSDLPTCSQVWPAATILWPTFFDLKDQDRNHLWTLPHNDFLGSLSSMFSNTRSRSSKLTYTMYFYIIQI